MDTLILRASGLARKGFFDFSRDMNLTAARQLITRCADRMNALGGGVVFDEWAIVSLVEGGARLAGYHGPRVEQFRARFVADIRPLRAELEGRHLEVGDFAFAVAAEGTAYDACVRIGPRAYLWWNHTHASLSELRERGAWLPAQREFAALCEAFRIDPLDGE